LIGLLAEVISTAGFFSLIHFAFQRIQSAG
jgi:hypothetical protein